MQVPDDDGLDDFEDDGIIYHITFGMVHLFPTAWKYPAT